MEKKTYYVSVQAGTALENQGGAAFEFEIEATPQEIDALQQLFEELDDAANDTFVRGMIPGIPYHQDPENQFYDDALQNVYRLLHELGKPETRAHIEQMGVLNATNS